MMDKLTQKSQEALQAAQELARACSHQELDGPHLALVLARQAGTIVPKLLQRAEASEADLDRARQQAAAAAAASAAATARRELS